MNIALLDTMAVRRQAEPILTRHGLELVGLLPRGTAGHVDGALGLDLLARATREIGYLDVASAEVAITDAFGMPVGIRLESELRRDADRAAVMSVLRPA